jgi:hypothetical protein
MAYASSSLAAMDTVAWAGVLPGGQALFSSDAFGIDSTRITHSSDAASTASMVW